MDNKNPYIPNGSTPIKNEIMFDIIAKGLLSYSEIRIVMYVIYKSWRYIDPENQRRQDWTNPLSIAQIAQEIDMKYPLVHRTLKQMISRKIILRKDKRYQFNEHYKQYITKSDNQEISLKVIKNITKSDMNITKSDMNITKSDILPPTNIDENKATKNLNKLSKETYINKINKGNLKIKNPQKIQISKPYILSKWFYEFRNIPAQPTSVDMRNFKMLLVFYPEEIIKKGIEWRFAHDPEGFWIKKITSASVYRNFGNWMAESSVKAISFTEWLTKNPNLDYRKFEDLLARADIFMEAFKESKKNRLVYFTEEDYENYRLAIRQKTREAKKEIKEVKE